jgi:3-hydroxyisobutyrate dehydrogenase-like beta-hydroxyacid dehydrogenase
MKIGFIGLGNVGGKLAGTLLRNGHPLVVRGPERTAGAQLRAAWGWQACLAPGNGRSARPDHHLPAVAGCIRRRR